MKRILVLIVLIFAVQLIAFAQTGQLQNGSILIYTRYVDPGESVIVSQRPSEVTSVPVFAVQDSSALDTLLMSPIYGLYYVFDNQVYTREGNQYTAQWSLPELATVADIASRALDQEAFGGLHGRVIINNIVLSPAEMFVAYDLTTLDSNGARRDEFVAIYNRIEERFRLIEVEPPNLDTLHSIGNLRWSPDGQTLAYAYPTVGHVDTEHITLVTNCTVDISEACAISRLDLPGKMPFMRTFDWSPDGSRFAYACNDDHLASHEVCIINVDGTGLVEYTTSETFKSDLHWSPDGRYLAYVAHPPAHQTQDIYLLDLETGQEVNFSNTPEILESVPFWQNAGGGA